MAVSLLTLQVSDLCLGKPALRPLSVSATVGEALSALKRLGHASSLCLSSSSDLLCVYKLCLADVICFLAADDNLKSPAAALQTPLSALLPKAPSLVKHLQPNASLLEAIDEILEGAQNLVIPIQSRKNSRIWSRSKNNQILQKEIEYCWITEEDIIRYLLNSIGVFSPTPAASVASLGLIEDVGTVLSVRHDAAAASALPLISLAVARQTSVAVVDAEGRLVGEISPSALNSCDETVAAAIATLSAGDLMAYIDWGGPPEDLVEMVKERSAAALLDWVEEDCSTMSTSSSLCSTSSDEEFGGGRSGGARNGGGRSGRGSEAIVCHPWSSLVAVMIQALAHRSGYVWVVEEDGMLNGIVTFAGMLRVFRERLGSM